MLEKYARSRKDANFRVICPKLEPGGTPSAGDWSGLYTNKVLRDGYGLDLYGGVTNKADGGHWTFRVGSPSALRVPTRKLRGVARQVSVAGIAARVYDVVGYEQGGGYYGGHTVVEWIGVRSACQVTVHGYGRHKRETAVAIMATVARQCTRARRH